MGKKSYTKGPDLAILEWPPPSYNQTTAVPAAAWGPVDALKGFFLPELE